MAYVKDAPVRITRIAIPLTRPPMMWGVPFVAYVIEVLGIGALFPIVQKFSVFLLWIPIHSIMYMLIIRDPHFLNVLKVKLINTPILRNRSFWNANSYSPDHGLKSRGTFKKRK